MNSTRELIAYCLIALTIAVIVPWAGIAMARRRRRNLRLRGIKRHGH